MMNTKQNPPRRGEIHWVDFNYKTQRGREIKKTRPSLVVSNDTQNEFDDQIMIVPLTSEEVERVEYFEVFINKSPKTGLEKPSKILLHRVQTIDKAVRLKGFIGIVDAKTMEKVNKALKLALDLEQEKLAK